MTDPNEKLWEQFSNLIHLVRKSGSLKVGMSAVLLSCATGKARIIICTTDIGGSSKRKLLYKAGLRGISVRSFGTKEQLSLLIDRQIAGIIAIEHSEFAARISALLPAAAAQKPQKSGVHSQQDGVKKTPTNLRG